MKKNLFIISVLSILLSGCADSYLERNPAGSTLTKSQYDKLSDKIEGSMRGVYAMLYTVSDHDEFGVRSIDMYGDLLSGDMALTSRTYGWFYTDEAMQSSTYRTGYVWAYYYRMLRNVNLAISTFKSQSTLQDTIAKYGLDGTAYKYTREEYTMAKAYAQALAMRGYIYSRLFYLYMPSDQAFKASEANSFKVFPLYTEDNFEKPGAFATPNEVFARIENDLTTAITYFDQIPDSIPRESKLEIDKNVARGILAYELLNKAYYYQAGSERNTAFTNAEKYAAEVINDGAYSILPNSELLTTGFNNVEHSSWMWGQDVTTETAGGLASFFGQVDIHSYSYAWAGDTKVIDLNLQNKIPKWDGRAKWFNDGKKNKKFAGCPDGKFYSAANPTSTADSDIDREWLSDNVFMRIESMYLIAAEAKCQLGDLAGAANYLNALTDNRLEPEYLNAATEYAEYKTTLSDATTLIRAIEYNWRLELWGEGYGLQTLKRMVRPSQSDPESKRIRGSNHLESKGKELNPSDQSFYFQIPSSETTYNNNI